MKNYLDINGIETTINNKEDVYNYAHNEAHKRAQELNEEITFIQMEGNHVEIYGIKEENNLSDIENVFYNALEEA
jgi:hypothetical protein